MAMLVVDGADAQTKAAHSAAGLPACSHSGAADSDECVTFEQILAGICGDRDAAVAAEELEANQITELESASQPSLTRIPEDVHADVSFDTTVGPPSAHYSGREPLVESVFFSDSDADWDQGRRHSKQTAEDGPKRRPGSKAAPHGPLPQDWKCVWRVPRGNKLGLVKVYVSPARKRYRTYKLAKAAFVSLAAAAQQQSSLPTFGLGAMVSYLRDVVACSLDISSDRMEMAMLAGVLRARRLLSSVRAERLTAMRAKTEGAPCM